MSTAISFYKLALNPVITGLKNAHYFISKGQAYAQAQGHDENDYLTASLASDMYHLIQQVQRFTDSAKSIPARVNPENPTLTLPDEEKTFAELLDRINRTVEFLESIDEKSFDGQEAEVITMKFAQGTVQVSYEALEYVTVFAHPNFWFHITTAYDILRMKGVDLSKFDFLNGAGLKKVVAVGAEKA